MVIFEENLENEILSFVNFLSKFPVENAEQGTLIIEELRLILKYMLENMNNHDDTVLIHKEIKNWNKKSKIFKTFKFYLN